MPTIFPFLTSPLTPPSALPLISPLPAAASSPSFTTRDFLFLFPPHAVTIVRTHRHRFSSHQRAFHAERMCDSAESFSALSPASLPPASLPLLSLPPFDSFSPPVTQASMRQRLDELCDTYCKTYPLPPANELILTILFIPLPGSASSASAAHPSPVPWCLIAHPRLTTGFPATLPLIAVSLHPYSRLLPTRKHSQWIRDRQLLEQQKVTDEVGEMLMHDGDDVVLEGLITNVASAEEDGAVRVCKEGVRLRGYVESLLLEATREDTEAERKADGEESAGAGVASRQGLSVKQLKAGAVSGVFITGSAVCIAGVQRVKWKEGEVRREVVMAEEGLQRVDRLRERLRLIMDKHVDADIAAAKAQTQAEADSAGQTL